MGQSETAPLAYINYKHKHTLLVKRKAGVGQDWLEYWCRKIEKFRILPKKKVKQGYDCSDAEEH